MSASAAFQGVLGLIKLPCPFECRRLMGKSLTEASEISSHRARCHPRVLYVDVAEAGALVLVGGLGGADCILQVECMLLPCN